ncbi:hypothetical protein C345_05208 [Cryptococcus neoformans A2-102-5]|uniref:Uncharacterized protein n=1 Tax=Cryptococcus neoformans Tu259-1 TaxID=1230072 RepID=A0A854Q5L3_CRYNE|nr:hypothetical protein C353_05373 [Cryptococcus neoformans var. grubii AD1-83a]OXG14392.1 hypothetical protein C361_05692 [Cryptococcus neoformans var. grubii Tu259-1]OXG51906.1 hypothetical protein C354_05315 [Cryptococcus neoformans var. grubii MW-RSA1955]OXG55856.1 hypothetical protein C352_05297 [Cryptococcus neoformans var. grubii CHC193]OXG59533.1 hypothetical protein C351_05302 [Cryptococcus neoformans var. grubii c8]OXG75304.1 hypothetical protein C350_05250 [Cryptococcus neoformans v
MTPPAHWQTISPQTRPLTLTVLDLTPLALTVSLSLTPSASISSLHHSHTSQPHHAHGTHGHPHTPVSHGHISQVPNQKNRKRHRKRGHPNQIFATSTHGEPSEDDEHEQEESDSTSHQDSSVSFKDLLRHGVLVYVNGQQSNNLFANVMDDEDEETEWEDETETSPHGEEIEENMEQGITRRRPRKARFGASAAEAAGKGTGKKKDEKPHSKGDKDRAVLVIYGLMPAQEYEIELRVVGMGGQENEALASTSVLIPAPPTPTVCSRSRANSLRSRSRPRSRSNSLTAPQAPEAAPDAPPSPTHAETIVPTPILNAVDTQAAQLRHLIATAHTEKELLQTQIKEARRTAQRGEAALKAEIELVKKGIEKAGGMDLRAKQKALALQEQVKQGWAGAEAAEKEMKAVEHGLADLEKRLEQVKEEVEEVKKEFKEVKEEEEKVKESDKKIRSEEDKKLAEMISKIEKLKTKKAKKEAEGAELERRLEELEKEMEEAEKKNEEEKANRSRTMSYYAAGYGQQHHDPHDPTPFGPVGAPPPPVPGPSTSQNTNRTLTTHPSLTNLSGPYAAGPAYRPKGAPGYTPRFPSGGARPSPTLPSPTQTTGFYPSAPHPVPPVNSSPGFRPPKVAPAQGTSTTRPGVNAAALPFHPPNYNPQPGWTVSSSSNPTSANPIPSGANNTPLAEHTTALMPPSLQHRIYLPNPRARPFQAPSATSSPASIPPTIAPSNAPSTNPSNSAVATAAAAATSSSPSSSNPSSPAFPPLPTSSSTSASKSTSPPVPQQGPSLASIVTRAVLAPTSALVQKSSPTGGMGLPGSGSGVGVGPIDMVGRTASPSESATGAGGVPGARTGTPPITHGHGMGGLMKRGSYTGDFPPLSPTWSGPGPIGGTGAPGTATGLNDGVDSGQGRQNSGSGTVTPGLTMREGMPPLGGNVGGGNEKSGSGNGAWGREGIVSGAILKKRDEQ